jgi:hypothetical protein
MLTRCTIVSAVTFLGGSRANDFFHMIWIKVCYVIYECNCILF